MQGSACGFVLALGGAVLCTSNPLMLCGCGGNDEHGHSWDRCSFVYNRDPLSDRRYWVPSSSVSLTLSLSASLSASLTVNLTVSLTLTPTLTLALH